MTDVTVALGVELPSRLTVVLVLRDHEALVERSLASIERELIDCPLIIVNVGSVDRSVEVASAWMNARGRSATVVDLPRRGSTIDALRVAVSSAKTDYICGMSADDYLGEGYGADARSLLAGALDFFACFRLTVVDIGGNYIESRRPRWSDSGAQNRMALLRGNPGTAPGALLPLAPFRD